MSFGGRWTAKRPSKKIQSYPQVPGPPPEFGGLARVGVTFRFAQSSGRFAEPSAGHGKFTACRKIRFLTGCLRLYCGQFAWKHFLVSGLDSRDPRCPDYQKKNENQPSEPTRKSFFVALLGAIYSLAWRNGQTSLVRERVFPAVVAIVMDRISPQTTKVIPIPATISRYGLWDRFVAHLFHSASAFFQKTLPYRPSEAKSAFQLQSHRRPVLDTGLGCLAETQRWKKSQAPHRVRGDGMVGG